VRVVDKVREGGSQGLRGTKRGTRVLW
jgi:hypothetical protein